MGFQLFFDGSTTKDIYILKCCTLQPPQSIHVSENNMDRRFYDERSTCGVTSVFVSCHQILWIDGRSASLEALVVASSFLGTRPPLSPVTSLSSSPPLSLPSRAWCPESSRFIQVSHVEGANFDMGHLYTIFCSPFAPFPFH
jgi:hypothetical protein